MKEKKKWEEFRNAIIKLAEEYGYPYKPSKVKKARGITAYEYMEEIIMEDKLDLIISSLNDFKTEVYVRLDKIEDRMDYVFKVLETNDLSVEKD